MPMFRLTSKALSKCAFLGVLPISLVAPLAAEAAPRVAPKMFKIGSRSLEGRPRTICVFEGKWADGEPLRYEAWDTCSKMRVRTIAKKDYKDAPSLGSGQYSVVDIPRESEVLEFENGVSKTLVFRDRDGIQREILSGD